MCTQARIPPPPPPAVACIVITDGLGTLDEPFIVVTFWRVAPPIGGHLIAQMAHYKLENDVPGKRSQNNTQPPLLLLNHYVGDSYQV